MAATVVAAGNTAGHVVDLAATAKRLANQHAKHLLRKKQRIAPATKTAITIAAGSVASATAAVAAGGWAVVATATAVAITATMPVRPLSQTAAPEATLSSRQLG
jgi:hypothetical protein